MVVLGGSGLDAGLLEPPELGSSLLTWVQRLASDFVGPPDGATTKRDGRLPAVFGFFLEGSHGPMGPSLAFPGTS